MNKISKLYISNFLIRYDKDGIIPFYKYDDFKGLKCEEYSFNNSLGIKIAYFYYYKDNYIKDKIILLLHGLGPGHTAYLREIDTLTSLGYKVLTLDYMGCDKSGGDSLISINEPTRDVIDLLKYLNIKEKIILFAHSLGGYTALNVIRLYKNIYKSVIISPFINVALEMQTFMKFKILTIPIVNYEKKINKEYFFMDNLKYLKNSKDNILFIGSTDDQMVLFNKSIKKIIKINNPHFSFIIFNDRKHNPNYSPASIKYMNEVFSKYNQLVKDNVLDTYEKRVNYFIDVSIDKLTEQDNDLYSKIIDYIK